LVARFLVVLRAAALRAGARFLVARFLVAFLAAVLRAGALFLVARFLVARFLVVLRAAVLRAGALFFVARFLVVRFFAVLRAAVLRAGALFLVARFLVAFLAAVLRAGARRFAVLRAAVLRAGALFLVTFLAAALRAGAFLFFAAVATGVPPTVSFPTNWPRSGLSLHNVKRPDSSPLVVGCSHTPRAPAFRLSQRTEFYTASKLTQQQLSDESSKTEREERVSARFACSIVHSRCPFLVTSFYWLPTIRIATRARVKHSRYFETARPLRSWSISHQMSQRFHVREAFFLARVKKSGFGPVTNEVR